MRKAVCTMFGRRHGARIDVHVWVDLDRSDLQTERLEQQASRRGCAPCPKSQLVSFIVA